MARLKPTEQSTTTAGGPSSKAVDGNTNSKYAFSSCTHTMATDDTASHWWQVDLGGMHQIGDVHIYNRADCCSERLRNVTVQFSLDGVRYSNVTSWSTSGFTSSSSYLLVIVRPKYFIAPARYVKIVKSPPNEGLTMCEVQIYEGHYVNWQLTFSGVPLICEWKVCLFG